MNELERLFADLRGALHHKDKGLIEALRTHIERIEQIIHRLSAPPTENAGPPTSIDTFASLPSSENTPRLPLPPAMPRSKPETIDAPPGSIGPILDLTAALEAEKHGHEP